MTQVVPCWDSFTGVTLTILKGQLGRREESSGKMFSMPRYEQREKQSLDIAMEFKDISRENKNIQLLILIRVPVVHSRFSCLRLWLGPTIIFHIGVLTERDKDFKHKSSKQ